MIISPYSGLVLPRSTIAYAGQVGNGGSNTSHSFVAAAIGAAASAAQRTRTVLVFATSNALVSSVTLGGVNMIPVSSAPGYAGGELAAYVLPWNNADTTATIVVNHNASSARCTIIVFSMYGLSQPTVALDTFTLGNFSSGSQWDCELNAASGGVIAAAIYTVGSGGPASGYTWSTLTEQADVLLAGTHRSGSALYASPIETPTLGFTFGATCSGTPGTTARCMNAVSFR